MAADGYLLGPNARKDLNALRRRYIKRQPDAGQPRHRRDQSGDATGGGGDSGGNTSGPCGCCNSFDCVDLCDQRDSEVVTSCDQCPVGSLKRYVIDVGNWIAFPGGLSGEIEVVHTTGCTWASAWITYGGGVYQWVLTQARQNSTMQLLHVSGADPLGLDDGWHQVLFKATGTADEWSCICNATLKASGIDRFPKPKGLNPSVCVKPNPTTGTIPTCPEIDGVVPCVGPFTFPLLSFPSSDPDEFPYGFTGSTGVPLTFEYNPTIEGCEMKAGLSTVPPTEVHSGVFYLATLNYATGQLDLLFNAYLGQAIATYQFGGSLVMGVNTLTLESQSDPSLSVWPETIDVIMTDCTFGASHPDTGYGCGYGASSEDPGPGECAGACIYRAVDANGILRGPTPPYTWSEPAIGIDSYCFGGCGCAPPPETPPVGAQDNFGVVCV